MNLRAAYAAFRKGYPITDVELAHRVGVSFSTVYSWDLWMNRAEHPHGRSPGRQSRNKLTEIARQAGLPLEVIAALAPTVTAEART